MHPPLCMLPFFGLLDSLTVGNFSRHADSEGFQKQGSVLEAWSAMLRGYPRWAHSNRPLTAI
jgi:hypothetical protein